MKKILAGIFSLMCIGVKSQVLFSDSFGNLTLQNDIQVFGSKTITTTYTTAPASYNLIEDGFKNNVGNNNAPNQPFNVASLKTTGWAIGYNANEADTFLISTSWLDTTAAVKRFIVTPVINSITGTSVLSWYAKSPDPNFLEGYEVYVTTNTTGTLTAGDFTTTPVFSIADGSTPGQGEKSIWTKHGISLGGFVGQNIRIAFKNISTNKFQLWIDDIVVENISNAGDAEISSSPLFYNYNSVNAAGAVFCNITNKGNTNIASIKLNYQVTGFLMQSQTFILSTVLTPYATTGFTFSIPYSIPAPGYYSLKISVNDVNGGADQNVTNDTLNTYICIVTSTPAKNTLVEQFLSAYDGYSPDGQEKLKALTSSSVIAVNIHDGDSLETPTINSLITTYRKTTTTAMIDRTFFTDVNSVPVARTSYSNHIDQRKSVIVPVSVSISNKNYDSASRVLTFTVNADFVGEVKGDYRMNAYLTENNIYGPVTDTTYNGWNQLSFMYNIPFSPYFQQGYYLSAQDGYLLNANQYKHMNVLDVALDGAFGVAGTIPSTGGTQGQTFTKTYSYTVPATPPGQFRYIPENMYIVAYVSEFDANQNKRTVLNCTQDKMISKNEALVSVNELSFASEFILYPNPSYGITNILIPENSFRKQVNISVTDILGKEVYNQNAGMSFGLIQINLNHLNNGTYFMVLSDGNTKAAKKLVIVK
jgi:hypothetical protein